MCQLCQAAKLKSRLRITETHVILVYEGYDFMGFPLKLFEGRNLMEYEPIVEGFLHGPNEWKEYVVR